MAALDMSGVDVPVYDAIFPIEWRSIPGYPNYYISNHGVVFNNKNKHLLTGWLRGDYKAVCLIHEGKPRTFTIHSLVARAFIPNPDNKPVIDHIGGKYNNHYTNLRWATYSENGFNRGMPKGNTSGFKGVSVHKKSGKFMVHLNRKHVGLYDTAEEGYAAYCTEARKLHGEFFHP